MEARNVRAQVRAKDGTLELNRLAAALYGGTASGAATVDAAAVPRVGLRMKFNGIEVGPLLKDGFDSNVLSGRGNVQLDVEATGRTIGDMRRALEGKASASLRDGSVRGINIAQTIRTAKTQIDSLRGRESAQAGTGSTDERTDFTELNASFDIRGGVARNDDLDIKSPLLRIRGSGEVDLGAERLNYLARTTVVPTLKGQGGPELQALKGLTVPVRLTGPFSAIQWQVDSGALVAEFARKAIDDEAKEAVRKSLDEEKSKLADEVREQFRGLFRK